MAHDEVILQCPECNEIFSVWSYTGPNTGTTFGIHNAPLSVIAEINKASKEGTIGCIHCGMDVGLDVLFIPVLRRLSSLDREGWRRE